MARTRLAARNTHAEHHAVAEEAAHLARLEVGDDDDAARRHLLERDVRLQAARDLARRGLAHVDALAVELVAALDLPRSLDEAHAEVALGDGL